MKTIPCKKYEPWLVTKVFDELSAADEQKLQAHLADCAKCRAALGEMQQVLSAMGAPIRPEMPAHFWEGYWHRLVARMEKDERAAPEAAFVPSRLWRWLRATWHEHPLFVPLARTAGILALLFAGVLVGHYWWPHPETLQIASSPPPQVHPVQARAEQWLERSKILLIGVVNEDFSEPAQSDFSQQRQVSRSLVTEARALRREIDPAANRQLLQLMSQLELVLLQIANLEAEHDLSAVELVRDGIARNGLLFKINITEMAQQEQRHVPPVKPDKKSL
ncbi:zf-HC2 domain-containing protein [candidate division KSB1 bacterium]|nr:zf-HC2 domain-containing protein [candidate division KSB1 bacterium]